MLIRDNADAGRDAMSVHYQRFRDIFDNLVRDPHDIVIRTTVAQGNREFIAAETSDHPLDTDRLFEPACDRFQNRVCRLYTSDAAHEQRLCVTRPTLR